MAQVVLLRGVNVGGHRTFRPAALARQLHHLDVVNIGAVGTFVVHGRVGRAQLRAEFARRMPFATEIMICAGRDIVGVLARGDAPAAPATRDLVRFVSLLARAPRSAPAAPFTIPAAGEWSVKILSRQGRFVIGMYRRHPKAINHLGTLDRVFGVPVTTRNWNTMTAIAQALTRARGRA